jgi:uncharacterized protein YbjQ (UPF0145 family)
MEQSEFNKVWNHVEYAVYLSLEDARDSALNGMDVDTNALTADIMVAVGKLVKYVKEGAK